MRLAQIENWALDVIHSVDTGHPSEDARVELKAEWVEAQKAARQIAGHANSARGDPILWLVGVDQKRGVTGVNHNDLANWYPKVVAEFDGVAPTMVDVNVLDRDKTVVALLFETDRAPFVIKNPAYGVEAGSSVAFEVPWRDGTSTRTARRSDLIRLLVPLLSLPEVEVLSGELALSVHDKYYYHVRMQLYVTPQDTGAVVIPFHRCAVAVQIPTLKALIDLGNIRLSPLYKPTSGSIGNSWEPDSHTVASTRTEVILRGPGRVDLAGEAWVDKQPSQLRGSTAEITAKLSPTHARNSVVFTMSMVWNPSGEKGEIARWTR
jgi:hypothetical protein